MKRGRIKPTSKKRRRELLQKKRDRRKKLKEEYGVKMSYWRYEGRKGVYWSLLSEYIRKRDLLEFGTCVSCGGKFEEIKQVQAGHYAPAGNCGFGLLFDKRNIHAECPSCNNPRISPGKLIQYRQNLVERYGEDWVKQLDDDYSRKVIKKEWSQKQYDTEIKKIKKEIQELDEEISKRF